jgi:hypothetical protein
MGTPWEGMNAQHDSPLGQDSGHEAQKKITALQHVTVCAKIEGQPRWLNMDAGETRVVEELLGIHPNMAPEMTAIYLRGATFVPAHVDALPAEPFGMFRVERAA